MAHTPTPPLNHQKLMDTAMLAGRIMLESNAETYRVEETMDRILNISNCHITEAFAMTTGLFATLDDPSMDAITLLQRVTNRDTNLSKISKVNHISRQLTSGHLSVEEAYRQLTAVDQAEYSTQLVALSVVGVAVFFCLILGGSFYDCCVTVGTGAVLVLCLRVKEWLHSGPFSSNTLSSFAMVAFASIIAKLLPWQLNIDAIIAGSIMPILPGTIITNAIRDTLRGDYMSGMARLLEALIIALSIAIGVAVGFLVTGGVPK